MPRASPRPHAEPGRDPRPGGTPDAPAPFLSEVLGLPESVFAHLVYGCANLPVRHTIARGRVVLRDHRHTTLDPSAIVDRAERLAPALWQRFHALGASQVDWLPHRGG